MVTNGYNMYINGQWVGHEKTFADYNPATGEVWAEIPGGTREDVKKAIDAAAATSRMGRNAPSTAGRLPAQSCRNSGKTGAGFCKRPG